MVDHPPFDSIITGLRFDVSVICFWLAPISVLNFIRRNKISSQEKRWNKAQNIYLHIGLLLFLAICFCDILYYKYYYTHINLAIFNWIQSPLESAKMIWNEALFRHSIFILLASSFLIINIQRIILRKIQNNPIPEKFTTNYYVFIFIALFLGMRGGLRAKPLNIKDANISSHYFFNQVAVSPIYNLYADVFQIEEPLYEYSVLTESQAFSVGKQYLKYEQKEYYKSDKPKPNIILILMESMATFKLTEAPFLSSLIKKSIYFDSFYSAGEHTYNGVYASLYAEPAIMQKHMLRWMENSSNTGLPGMLKNNGYFNMFHIPHSRYFDNMGTFLRKHYFDSIIDKVNIPSDLKGGSVWGTSDHLFLENAIRNMDFATAKGKPVFNVLLTISDHPPFYIPKGENIPAFAGNISKKIIHYADWSLERFFTTASKKPWFDNTIFVLLGDHGNFSGKQDYPLPLSFHHIPCLIYSKGTEKKAFTIHSLGAQQDLLPTLQSYLQYEVTENPLSVNLFHSTRPFTMFCSDSYIGLLKNDSYSILNNQGDEEFYSFDSAAVSEKNQNTMFQTLLTLNKYAALRLEKSIKKLK